MATQPRFPPPPPPPPPPLPPSTPQLSVPHQELKLVSPSGTIVADAVADKISVGRNAVLVCQQYLKSQGASMKNIVFVSHYRPALPIVQQGPVCGLVALAMAAHLAGNESILTEHLLDMARDKGYTKQGEMFSVDNMQQLASHVISSSYSAKVVNNIGCIDMLHRLFDEEILLVPYDADKNHSPCQKKGHSAHWAVITGFLLATDKNRDITTILSSLQMTVDESENRLQHLGNIEGRCGELLKNTFSCVDSLHAMFVYGHQGKSKHIKEWLLEELVASNADLVELDPNRSADEYVVPAAGLRECLCNKFVTLHRNKF